MNGERRIQRVHAALRPEGGSKPDWQIVAEIARAMGSAGFGFNGPEEIWDEVRALCHGARGMTYARLDHGGLQWPCPADDHPGTALLHIEQFGQGPRATLECIDYRSTSEQTTPQYPFLRPHPRHATAKNLALAEKFTDRRFPILARQCRFFGTSPRC